MMTCIMDIKNDISEVKGAIDKLMEIDCTSRIPIGLKNLISESFKCKICHCTTTPPVIATKCCKCIIGCEVCINGWFSGEDALTKTCPNCRADRGYNETMPLKGLDDFLEVWRKASNDNSGDDSQ